MHLLGETSGINIRCRRQKEGIAFSGLLTLPSLNLNRWQYLSISYLVTETGVLIIPCQRICRSRPTNASAVLYRAARVCGRYAVVVRVV